MLWRSPLALPTRPLKERKTTTGDVLVRQRKILGALIGAFLAGIGAAGAASAAAAATTPTPVEAKPTTLPPVSQSYATTIAQVEQAPPGAPTAPARMRCTIANPGSDFMVDVMIGLGYKYVAATPGTTFRGLQESVISYAMGKMEWLSVRARRYLRFDGTRLCQSHRQADGDHGAQHRRLAARDDGDIQLLGRPRPDADHARHHADGALRSSAADRDHSMVDNAATCRGYIKYDEQPGSCSTTKNRCCAATAS